MTRAEVKRIRERLGLTQTELGARLGKSMRQIIRYELGEWEVPPAVALALKQIEAEGKKKRRRG